MPDTKRYARLKMLLQEKITSGAYQPGDRFFSQNEIMRKYGLSFSTVIRALDELVGDGYLIRKQGKGTFIASISPKQQTNQRVHKYITIFAPWHDAPGVAFGQINAAGFYRQLNEIKPDWMHLRLVPVSPDTDSLEPWLFSREPSHAAIALYPNMEQMAVFNQMASQYPVVVLSDETPIAGFSSVVTSFSEATALAVRNLIGMGHTTIALIQPPVQNPASEACVRGYRSALRKAAYPFNEQLLARCKPSDPTGYNAMLKLFDVNSSVQITSVIATGSSLLPGVSYAADAMQLKMPEQFTFIGIDDQQTGEKLGERAARVIFPARETAQAILSQVLNALTGTTPSTEAIVLPELIPAGTPHIA